MRWIRPFRELRSSDIGLVGGKNASLGEMLASLSGAGVRVPDGFAVTVEGYRHYLRANGLEAKLQTILRDLRVEDAADLARGSAEARALFGAPMPEEMASEIAEAHRALGADVVVVRSSATAEDLPGASFAGQQESFLNVRGARSVVDAVRRTFASLFTARAIHYRRDLRIDERGMALSAGVQRMVRADLASAGVAFTLEPESGHRGVLLITSSWGLAEPIVQGRVEPDQFLLHKATLAAGFRPIIRRTIGSKDVRCVLDDAHGTRDEPVDDAHRFEPSLPDDDLLALGRACLAIERHYSDLAGQPMAMDVEWAKDGETGELFIVQARPETAHAKAAVTIELHHLEEHGEVLATGFAVGEKVVTGDARVVLDPRRFGEFRDGEVLVTEATDPDWEPIMKRAAGVVTQRGGRTSHAAIVARELGVPAVVGAAGAIAAIPTGTVVTLSCAEGATGRVFRGALQHRIEHVDASRLPATHTRLMVNLADPEQAFRIAELPCDGVGLLRMEFVFSGWVGVHPMALVHFDRQPPEVQAEIEARSRGYGDKREFFVDRISQGIGTIAAAFHPRPVILRLSDFKTNEYARLVGGAPFEPHEENPMLGWRGASRYDHPVYRDGFLLELEAVRRVREGFGLTNLQLMIPFCRTPDEGRRVLELMARHGLARGHDGLEVLVMAELPSNILLARRFAALFDGFSIGSNDLTQLTLGIDRDSATIAALFDEQNEAVRWSCARLIDQAHEAGRHVGICGQAPSDDAEFAAFLVEHGIDSISVTPDALLRTRVRVARAERERGMTPVSRPEPGNRTFPIS